MMRTLEEISADIVRNHRAVQSVRCMIFFSGDMKKMSEIEMVKMQLERERHLLDQERRKWIEFQKLEGQPL